MTGESKMSRDEGTGIVEGRGWISLLKDIEERYYAAFTDLGPGDIQQFKNLIMGVEDFLDRSADPTIDFRIKLDDYTTTSAEVAEYCRFYGRWLGSPLMGKLRHEIYEILEQAITWWGRQEAYNAIEVR